MNNEVIKLSKISKKFVGNNKDISVEDRWKIVAYIRALTYEAKE